MYFLYIDESYDRNSKYIVLSGVIIPDEEWGKIDFEIKRLKERFFGDSSFNLKLVRRRKYDPNQRFNKLSEEDRKNFNIQFWNFFKGLKVTIISALIDREKMEVGDKNFFFRLAYSFIIQRFEMFLQTSQSKGIIIMDSSENEEITSLFNYHKDCLEKGVPIQKIKDKIILSGKEIEFDSYKRMDLRRILEHLFFLEDSYSNHLQLTDIVCSAISSKYNRNRDYFFNKVLPKIRKNPEGKIEGWGIKIFPS